MSKKLRSIALPIVGSLVAPGIGTALGSTLSGAALSAVGSGLGSLAGGANVGQAALGGLGSYIGGNIGASLGGPSTANVLQSALGPDLGSSLGQIAGGGAYLSPVNALLGSAAGSNLASSLVPQKTSNPSGAGSYKPSREDEQSAPASFSSFGQLSPQQLSSNIATSGVYGGGASPDESSYFLNLINRRLIDDSGSVDTDLNDINPIENSYLSQLGLGGYNDATSLLEAISKYRAA